MLASIRTGTTADIVQRKLADARVQLHQHAQRLADAAGRAENSDLGVLQDIIPISTHPCESREVRLAATYLGRRGRERPALAEAAKGTASSEHGWQKLIRVSMN